MGVNFCHNHYGPVVSIILGQVYERLIGLLGLGGRAFAYQVADTGSIEIRKLGKVFSFSLLFPLSLNGASK